MIVSKPKVSSLFSLGVFLLISYGTVIFSAVQILTLPYPAFYYYLLLVIIGAISLYVTYKVVTNFKYITVGKEKMEIYFPLIRKRYLISLTSLTSWKETVIKSAAGTYKELEFRFQNNHVIKMTIQENSNYDKIFQYFQKKHSKLFKKG